MNTEDLDKDFVEQEIPIDGEEANEPVEDAQEAAEETAEETPQTDELAEAQAEIARLKDQYLRQVAEFDNYRKRTLKEKSELILNGGEKTITALLPVLDDLQRALANAEKSTDYDTLKSGLDLIAKKLLEILGKQGLKAIDTTNADFDTDYHEAVAMVPTEDSKQKGKVIDCVETGYTLNDKVIRHAKVAVGA